jgi:hypothetical protein
MEQRMEMVFRITIHKLEEIIWPWWQYAFNRGRKINDQGETDVTVSLYLFAIVRPARIFACLLFRRRFNFLLK